MRLSPSCFYDMELSEFLLAAEGFQDLQQYKQREHWERTRWLAAIVLQPHAKKGTRIKPTDIAKFPWEKKQQTKGDNRLMFETLKKWANA